MTTKLLSRWRGPYKVVEKIGEKTYVVLMDNRGKLEPRVVNFRNMWKGRKIGKENEEADLEGFPDEKVDGENLEIARGKRRKSIQRKMTLNGMKAPEGTLKTMPG